MAEKVESRPPVCCELPESYFSIFPPYCIWFLFSTVLYLVFIFHRTVYGFYFPNTARRKKWRAQPSVCCKLPESYFSIQIVIRLVELIVKIFFRSVLTIAVPPEGLWILGDEGGH
jgi:hypothetical protein